MRLLRLLGTIAWIGSVVLAGCTVAPLAPQAPPGIDLKMGQSFAGDPRALILVTMREGEHRALNEGGKIGAPEPPARYAQLLAQWQQRLGIRRVADWPLSSLGVRCLVFEITGTLSREAIVRELSTTEFVETAQALQEFNALAEAYNDPLLKMQHGFTSMNVAAAHRWASGSGVRVAVIDTGVDSAHPELSGRIKVKRNLVNGDPSQFDGDVHGTAVAGVIAAAANNAQGLVGVAPQAEVLGLKACWQNVPGYGGAVCNSFTLAKALNVAIDQQVDVINLSLGGPPDALLARLVQRAVADDIVVVGAVDARHPDGFPGAVPGVLAVNETETRTRGAAVATALFAPGQKIVSARPGVQYDMYSGSSLSTAQVAGIAALVRERKPHFAGNALGTLLRATADPDSGAVNACRALARIVGQDAATCR